MDIDDGRALAQDGTRVTKRWTPTDLRAADVPGRKAKGGPSLTARPARIAYTESESL
jgi:hypothetical protein